VADEGDGDDVVVVDGVGGPEKGEKDLDRG
jgi:hypothetical protein